MQRSKMFQLLCLSLAGGGLCIWLLQVVFGLNSPVMPYDPQAGGVVQGPVDARFGGSLQPGDSILTFNGKPIASCLYLVDNPFYAAPRNVPIPVTFLQQASNSEAKTNIVLTNPSALEMLNRSPDYFVTLVFVVAGVIIIMGGLIDMTHLLVGLALLNIGLMFSGWQDYHTTPLAITAYWGVPASAFLLTISHAI